MRRDFNLGFVAGALEFFAAFEKEFVQFVAVSEGVAEKRRGEAMKAFIEGIEKDQAVVGENASEKSGEGAAIGGLGKIGFVEQIAEGLTEKRLGAYDQVMDFLAETDTADGHVRFGGLGEREFLEFAFVEPGDVADFVDVVIFGGHPENRNGGDSFLREFFGGLDGAEGFVEGVGRAAEEADLLAADYGDGAFGETIEIFLRFGAGVVEEILRAENAGDL